MAWTEVTASSATWSTITYDTSVDGRILYEGMPMGLLLAITYDTSVQIGWIPTSSSTVTWTIVT